MRVLVITQYFWPENFRINDLVLEFINRGHEVTVLTGKPNYPGGKVFTEFSENPAKFSQFEGVRIIRVPMISRGKGNFFRLLLNYTSFALAGSLWGWMKLRNLHFDIIFVYEPSPITVGIPAILLKKKKQIPIVFWTLDLWPETLEAVGFTKSKFVLNLVGKLVSFIYNRCDLILGQSKAFLEGIALYCDETEKIRYFPSWSEAVFSKVTTETVKDIVKFDGEFKVLFAGNIGEAQDFSSIVGAAEILKNKKAKVKLFIVGDGRLLPWLKQLVDEKGLHSHLCLLGCHPLEVMPDYYASADALLVSMKCSRVFAMTIPAKVQSYLMAGKPILGMLNGEGARVINEAKAGYTCCSGEYKVLAENILDMTKLSRCELDELGENARKYANNEFDRAKLISKLEQWFLELIN